MEILQTPEYRAGGVVEGARRVDLRENTARMFSLPADP